MYSWRELTTVTRKRFIKLLMAAGQSRNLANVTAQAFRMLQRPYMIPACIEQATSSLYYPVKNYKISFDNWRYE